MGNHPGIEDVYDSLYTLSIIAAIHYGQQKVGREVSQPGDSR